MSRERAAAAARRLNLALEMSAAGIEIELQNLRRRYPEASEEELRERLARWLGSRPGAEHGDSWGRPVPPTERFG